MKLSYPARFPTLFALLEKGKRPFCCFDQDGTVTCPTGKNEEFMSLCPGVIPAVKALVAKGGFYAPVSARSPLELANGYKDIGELPYGANDGFYIFCPGNPVSCFSENEPDYSDFSKKLFDLVKTMDGVTMKPMGAFYGLFVSRSSPSREECELFFGLESISVSEKSGGLPMVVKLHPMGITMEPRDNRDKADVIQYFEDACGLGEEDVLIVAGDSRNDIPALQYAKRKSGFAFYVKKGAKDVPPYANYVLDGPEDCAGLLQAIADATDIKNLN